METEICSDWMKCSLFTRCCCIYWWVLVHYLIIAELIIIMLVWSVTIYVCLDSENSTTDVVRLVSSYIWSSEHLYNLWAGWLWWKPENLYSFRKLFCYMAFTVKDSYVVRWTDRIKAANNRLRARRVAAGGGRHVAAHEWLHLMGWSGAFLDWNLQFHFSFKPQMPFGFRLNHNVS